MMRLNQLILLGLKLLETNSVFYAIVLSLAWNLAIISSSTSEKQQQKEITSAQNTGEFIVGAQIFSQYCTLCHGMKGMGEGILALKVSDYPNTNLFVHSEEKTQEQVQKVIHFGKKSNGKNLFMPPFKEELTQLEIAAVSKFILFLRNKPVIAQQLIKEQKQSNSESLGVKQGKDIYMIRCTLCHGKSGEGDGRMSKLLKSPPPFDLTASRLPDEYLQKIIKGGGEAVGRSKHMPPWGDQLSQQEVDAVIDYIKTIRD
ncbi:cytochrome c [Aliikangiella sp. IMCC44359]|uniref:cytochrome c n=1 Tax=Aliikangiella sp. IMCC44359 TaxID=3459125 RepID=UPI00403B2189